MTIANPINLVLVYAPNALDVADFEKVAARIRSLADNIKVYIHTDSQPDSALLDELAQHPTFVFSPMQLQAFYVLRGRTYAGRPMEKSEQLLRLELSGVSVPMWTSLDRGKRFEPDVWGEYVIVKPEISSRGRGVKVVSTQQLNHQSHKVAPFKRNGMNFIVQKMVRSPVFSKIRVQTLFDEVLHARQFRFKNEIAFDNEPGLKEYERQFITTTNTAEYCFSEAVFALARKCYITFDDVPMLGLDVMIDESDKPVFIEANPGGNTWHYSSALTGKSLRKQGIFLEKQFGAFERAGTVLARRALKEAT